MDSSATLSAQEVIRQIKAALKEGLEKYPQLALEKVDLSLKTLVEKQAGAGLKFSVPLIDMSLEAGGDIREEQLQTISLSFVPEETTRTSRGHESFNIQEQLGEGIDAIAELFELATLSEPRWSMATSSIELSFILTKDGKISLIAKAGAKKSFGHSLKLHLKAA
ncbi:MAG: trypco2 family protein [Deinococcales bacterium]